MKLAKFMWWNVEDKCKAWSAGLSFGGEETVGHKICSMLWADNVFHLSESKAGLRMMVEGLAGPCRC